MTKKIIVTVLIIGLLTLAIGLALIQSKSFGVRTDTRQLSVVASYYPLYDFAKAVGGDKVAVTNITPAGAEPHDYEPSAKELAAAHDAKVFIYNGGHMEPWVNGFLSDYTHTAIKASQGITLRDAEDDEGHGVVQDPHFWLDPVLAEQIVNTIRDGFAKADPANKNFYASNAQKYTQQLAELNTSFAHGLAHCTLDTVISSHEAFSYVAARYNFKVVSIAGIEPDQEPSVAKMAELTDLVRQKGIRYIFFESLVSPRLAETIAQETGADTLVFDPIEGVSAEDQAAGKDYISIQYENLRNLQKALGCSDH